MSDEPKDGFGLGKEQRFLAKRLGKSIGPSPRGLTWLGFMGKLFSRETGFLPAHASSLTAACRYGQRKAGG
jgi:hypothetical protein